MDCRIFGMDFYGIPEDGMEVAKSYMTGKKIPDTVAGKGGNFVFHLSNISEMGLWIPRLARKRLRSRYYLSGDAGVAIFDKDNPYHSPMDVIEQNPPQISLERKRVMTPTDSLFDEMCSAFVEKGYQVQRDEIAEGYLRFAKPLYYAFLSRAIDKGFVDGIYFDIEHGR